MLSSGIFCKALPYFQQANSFLLRKQISRNYVNFPNPFIRTWEMISSDIHLKKNKKPFHPQHADIVIIGGGFIGSSVAYWLKCRAGAGLSVVVLDKDLTYKDVQNNVVLGTLSQHYSLPENIYLAQYGADFFRNTREHLGVDVDIQYVPYGQLILASEKYAQRLEKNVDIQLEHGTKNELLSPDEIRKRYPWIDTSDIKLGCIGTESEGVFNSWRFLRALVSKSQQLGATYVNAEVTGFEIELDRGILMEGAVAGSYKKINKVLYKTEDNESHTLNFAACILAAGDQSGHVAKLARIGNAEGLLAMPLPIQRREYNVYSIESNEVLPIALHTPSVVDTSGLWLRRNRLENSLLCGHVPLLTMDDDKSLKDEFDDLVKPSLLNRIPEFKNVKINKVSTEMYDYNTYDDTGIIGPHPYHGNIFLATGFGKEGCQHAPGIGRAIAELLIDGHFTSIDLTRFGFDRILTDKPLVELNVY